MHPAELIGKATQAIAAVTGDLAAIAIVAACFGLAALLLGVAIKRIVSLGRGAVGGSHAKGWVALAGLVLIAGYAGWQGLGLAEGSKSPAQAREGGGARGTNPQAVPVHVARVEKKDFPVFLNGLGTVQPTNMVLVRSRVDGQIETVAFQESQLVKEGDLLVQIDAAPFQAALDQANAKLAQDEANLDNAERDLKRTSTLASQGNATLQLLDQRTAQVAQLKAQIAADRAAITSAQVQLGYTTIRSPITGRVGFRLIDRGNIVHANDQAGIVTITQLQPISVIFTAPEQNLPAIQEALKAGPLRIFALTPDGKKELGEGTVSIIDNQVDMASGTVRLKASFENADNALWPGLSVATRLLINTLPSAVVVPDTAVQRGPNGLYAYVVGADGRAQLRQLKVGLIDGNTAQVQQGLRPGEEIVTAGHYRVQPGSPLQIERAAETPNVSKME
jgi:multidrug efflux system membrane fusion protein